MSKPKLTKSCRAERRKKKKKKMKYTDMNEIHNYNINKTCNVCIT